MTKQPSYADRRVSDQDACLFPGAQGLKVYSGCAVTTGTGWTVETVSVADAEVEALPVALRAGLVRLPEAVENVGLETLRAPHARQLDGKLWELRVRADAGNARGIYVTMAERRVVVLRVFAKKSRKIPRRALATARRRMRQMTT